MSFSYFRKHHNINFHERSYQDPQSLNMWFHRPNVDVLFLQKLTSQNISNFLSIDTVCPANSTVEGGSMSTQDVD